MGYDPAVYPRSVAVHTLSTPIAVVGTWTPTYTNNNAWLSGYLQSSAQNDEASWYALLGPGTYSLDTFFRGDVNAGVYTITIDGASLTSLSGSADTVEGYNVSAGVATRTTITGIVIPAPATNRVVKIKMATKNASSTNYLAKMDMMIFTRTA